MENPSFFPRDLDNTEAIWVDIVFHSQRLALSVMYRPPKNLFFYESLDKQLRSVAKRSKNSLVMEDLNTDLRGTCNNLGESLQRVLNRNGLVNVIKDYRRITEYTKSLIDLSITSIKSKVKLWHWYCGPAAKLLCTRFISQTLSCWP